MTKVTQSALDKFEEYILMKLFADINNIEIGQKIRLFLITKNIKVEDFINQKIQQFEYFMSDFITLNGLVDGEKLTEYVVTKYPKLNGYVTFPSLKPIEYAKIIDSIIGLDALGNLIRNF